MTLVLQHEPTSWTLSKYGQVVRAEEESSNSAADAAMDRYADGDDSAFPAFYDALAPRLYRFLLRKIRDISRAEDLLQQTMLHVHRARCQFVRGSRATPWVFVIATRLYLDLAKRKKLEILAADADGDTDCASDWPAPDFAAETREIESLIRERVGSLSIAQREAFELVHFDQMSHSEAAEVLGVSVASIKLRLQRANRIVREALNGDCVEGLQS